MPTQPENPRMLTVPVTPMRVEPLTLEGQHVRLEPLTLEHLNPLCEIALDADIWRWMPAQVRTPDDMRQYIELALKQRSQGTALAFATFSKSAHRVVGSSRYLNIDHANHRLEIGATFLGKPWQRTVVNTEAKYLMLSHAFETLGCLRVEFKTDVLNTPSRSALLRLGAVQEGIFRNHIICADGRVRHSVYFSIIDEDWLTVKTNLLAKLARP